MKGNRGIGMSRACEQFACKTGGATDWGSATLGRPRGRGFIKNLNNITDTDVVCNGNGQVVAALVEDARMLGRISLGRVRGPGERGGEVTRGSSPPLTKQSLRLVAVKDDDGRIRVKPQGSLDDSPNKSEMENRVQEESKREWKKNGSGEEGSRGNRNVRTGCNTASDATAMRGITMKDGVRVGGGLEQNSTKGAELNPNNKKGAELNNTKGKGAVSEMMSTQAGYTIKRTGLKIGAEKKVETCFLCGQPSEDQVKLRFPTYHMGVIKKIQI